MKKSLLPVITYHLKSSEEKVDQKKIEKSKSSNDEILPKKFHKQIIRLL